MIRFLTQMYRRLVQATVDSCVHAEPKMIGFGLIASVGFPLYYFVWSYVVPQPYENLNLRLAAMAVAAPLLVTRYWPAWLRAYLPLYWYTVLTLCLPFFFTFMLLQNEVNTVWSMATVTAVLLVILVIDTVSAIVMVLIGTAAAFAVYALVSGNPIPWADYMSLTPVYAFAVVTGAFFNLTNEREKRAKTLTARALGGHVAHELGNPLQTISFGARQVKEYVPGLVDTYRAAKRAGLEVPPIAENHLRFLSDAGGITEVEVSYSLMVIDMMLKKAGTKTIGTDELRDFGIMQCVDTAIRRYAFKNAEERAWIEIVESADFRVHANEILVMHVVFNLLKNGIYALKAARRYRAGSIRIWAVPTQTNNRLHILDNGTGMSPQTLARAFQPFFTTRESGAGLGLHFCRDVMHRFGGEITCRSRYGEFTEFVLHFPVANEAFRAPAPLSDAPGDTEAPQPKSAGVEGRRWKGDPAPSTSPGGSG
jgi:two-component system CAI-1 autoinducer sensor kinase/phosphatase CqsS